jgi:hypothetical protein
MSEYTRRSTETVPGSDLVGVHANFNGGEEDR